MANQEDQGDKENQKGLEPKFPREFEKCLFIKFKFMLKIFPNLKFDYV